VSSPAIKDFTYTSSSLIFPNEFTGDCGGFTTCKLQALGCIDPYVGNVIMNSVTFALSSAQNIDAGYDEHLCVVCENTLSGTTGTMGNSWRVY